MSDFATIEVSELSNVTGGQEGAAVRTAARVAGRASRALPVVGQVISGGMAAYEGYNDYSRARAQGQGVLPSLGQGALGALNSLTWGASNWLLGR